MLAVLSREGLGTGVRSGAVAEVLDGTVLELHVQARSTVEAVAAPARPGFALAVLAGGAVAAVAVLEILLGDVTAVQNQLEALGPDHALAEEAVTTARGGLGPRLELAVRSSVGGAAEAGLLRVVLVVGPAPSVVHAVRDGTVELKGSVEPHGC